MIDIIFSQWVDVIGIGLFSLVFSFMVFHTIVIAIFDRFT